jgi:predicted porin
MNKKLLAVAVAGALAVPAATAMAQTSTVQIGGSLNMLWYYHKPDNNNVGRKTDILEQSEPELYVRGEEKLGGAIGSVWFQCASEFDIFGDNQFGWCGRNSALGFRGNYGNFFAGNWDLPHKLMTNQIRGAFSGTNALWGGTARLHHGGSGSGVINPAIENVNAVNAEGTGNAVSFYRRQSNSIHYHSPQFGGFQFQGAFSTANEGTGLALSPLQPRLFSTAVHWNSGPIYVGAAWERHQDYNPGNRVVLRPTVGIGGAGTTVAAPSGVYSGGDDDSWQVGAAYTFAGVFKLSGYYTRNEYETSNTTQLETNAFSIFADWKLAGPHTIRAGYGKLRDVKGNSIAGSAGGSVGSYVSGSNTGADWWNIHYEYAFSKRTAGVVAYNALSNDSAARIGMGKVTPTLGGSQTSLGVGLKHRF